MYWNFLLPIVFVKFNVLDLFLLGFISSGQWEDRLKKVFKQSPDNFEDCRQRKTSRYGPYANMNQERDKKKIQTARNIPGKIQPFG